MFANNDTSVLNVKNAEGNFYIIHFFVIELSLIHINFMPRTMNE